MNRDYTFAVRLARGCPISAKDNLRDMTDNCDWGLKKVEGRDEGEFQDDKAYHLKLILSYASVV